MKECRCSNAGNHNYMVVAGSSKGGHRWEGESLCLCSEGGLLLQASSESLMCKFSYSRRVRAIQESVWFEAGVLA